MENKKTDLEAEEISDSKQSEKVEKIELETKENSESNISIVIHDRYVAIKLIFSNYYGLCPDILLSDKSFRDMLDEDGILINDLAVKFLVGKYKENEHLAEEILNKKFKNNSLDDFVILPASIMKLLCIELVILKNNPKVCISDYLSISKIFGLSRAEIGLINALLHQVYVEF